MCESEPPGSLSFSAGFSTIGNVVDTAILSIAMSLGQSMFRQSTVLTIGNSSSSTMHTCAQKFSSFLINYQL